MEGDPATDTALMLSFIRWLVGGGGSREEYTAAIDALKSRGLVHQTRAGRPLPTEAGASLWAHARRVVSAEILGAQGQLRRPCFVVYGADGRPVGFRDWDDAVSYARWAMEENPDAFAHAGRPEDLVEAWDRALVSPEEAERIEQDGTSVLNQPSQEPVDAPATGG